MTTDQEWTVTGMDCGACAAKVRGAVARLPGVDAVDVTLMSERLRLTLDEAQTPRARVEAAVRALGYDITASPAANPAADLATDPVTAPASTPAAADPDRAWYHGGKGRLVIGTGVLLVAAWAISWLHPALATGAFVLATLIGLVPVARHALRAARMGMPFTIEMLMTIAAGGALVIGAAQEAALVVFLFATGELLEGIAARRARAGIRALAGLVPDTALLTGPGGLRRVPAASLAIGQIVLVRPGDRVPADGEVTEGTAGVDESPVTGESLPRRKQPGDPVHAGSICTDAALHLRVTRAAADNTIARIIRLVSEAESARAPTERFIDRFSRIYMPLVVGAALLVALGPPLLLAQPWETWTYRALALLLIGCPCALVISVPAAIAASLATGARNGLLMKGGAVIEAVAATTQVAFDKTGTLTEGRPQVTEIIALDGTMAEVLALAAGVEAGSSHPLAQAILSHAALQGIAPLPARAARVLPGAGAEAVIAETIVRVGSPQLAPGLLDAATGAAIARLETDGQTVVAVIRADRVIGLLALQDILRPEALEGLRQLRALGIPAVMLTGDNARTAAAIAAPLGITPQAGLRPQDKLAAIRAMTLTGRIMMVGDGINDAPALAAAHVGVAMGSGTDVALDTADAALLRNRVTDVAGLIRLARATMANIRQNVAIALGLKAVFLVTTLLGITGLWPAILADTGATVLVTLNALRLLRRDPGHGT